MGPRDFKFPLTYNSFSNTLKIAIIIVWLATILTLTTKDKLSEVLKHMGKKIADYFRTEFQSDSSVIEALGGALAKLETVQIDENVEK